MRKRENPNPPLTLTTEKEWDEALDEPGAFQMGYLKELLQSRSFVTMEPNQSLIAKNLYDPEGGYLVACTGEGFAFVYAPTGKKFELDYRQLPFDKILAQWYNPRNGSMTKAWMIEQDGLSVPFDPPGEKARGNDWVLILDDASR
jgi:hypothetical protein